jgi:hypothetical protein
LSVERRALRRRIGGTTPLPGDSLEGPGVGSKEKMNLNNRCKFQIEQVGRQDPKRRELEGFWPNVAVACAIQSPRVGFLGRYFLVILHFSCRKFCDN